MVTKYKKLLEINFTHEYFKTGVCRDFVLVPSESTVLFLKNHKMIFRSTHKGGIILFEVWDDLAESPIVPTENPAVKFVFYIKLVNSSFMKYTQLPAADNRTEAYYVTESQVVNESTASDKSVTEKTSTVGKILKAPQRFKYDVEAGTSNVQVSNSEGVMVADILLDDKEKHDNQVTIHLQSAGRYSLAQLNGNVTTKTEAWYLDNQLYRANILGIVEVTKDFSAPGAYDFVVYRFLFAAKWVRWHYHIALAKDYTSASIDIQYTTTPVAPDNDIPDRVYPELPFANITPGVPFEKNQIVSFRSDKLPLYEEANKKLKLVVSESGNVKEVKLANPSLHSIQPEVFIHI